jgi:hypothetical protein
MKKSTTCGGRKRAEENEYERNKNRQYKRIPI